MKPLPWRRDSWTCTASIGLRSKANARFARSRTWSHRSNRTSEGQTPPVARRRRIIGPSKNQLQLIPHDPPPASGILVFRNLPAGEANTRLATLGNVKVFFLLHAPCSATPRSCFLPGRHARQPQRPL